MTEKTDIRDSDERSSGRGKKVTMKLFQVTEGNMQQSDWAIRKFLSLSA